MREADAPSPGGRGKARDDPDRASDASGLAPSTVAPVGTSTVVARPFDGEARVTFLKTAIAWAVLVPFPFPVRAGGSHPIHGAIPA